MNLQKTFNKKRRQEIIDDCKQANACQREFRKLNKAKTINEFVQILWHNIEWVIDNDILTQNELILSNTSKDNSGHSNSGNKNSGGKNSGDWNSGKWNSGNWNSGDINSGDKNSGDWNSGNWNSGNWNSGKWNSGHSNSGNKNSGDWNSGNWNSGNWNSCNRESGYFNSKDPKCINVFNKPCTRETWYNAEKPNFIFDIRLNEWVGTDDMTKEEKEQNPEYKTTGGYLKTYTYKEAWQNAYKKATKKDIELLKNLPNFNAKVFEEITGIKIKQG